MLAHRFDRNHTILPDVGKQWHLREKRLVGAAISLRHVEPPYLQTRGGKVTNANIRRDYQAISEWFSKRRKVSEIESSSTDSTGASISFL